MTLVTPSFRAKPASPLDEPSAPALPAHCAMFALDIAAFGTRRRNDVQAHLRRALYSITEDACHAIGIPWKLCHHEDRGDGLLFIAPAGIGADALIGYLVAHLRAELRRHNRLASAAARFRIRMAVHAGYVQLDDHGVSGNAPLHLFRILEATEFKGAAAGAEFALVVSEYLYQEVIRHGPGLIDPAAYRPLAVAHKETRTTAWLWLPPLSSAPPPGRGPRPLALTREETDIATLMASGWPRKKIAAELGLTVPAVDQRIRRILAELCLTTSNPPEVASAFAARYEAFRLAAANKQRWAGPSSPNATADR
jgi:DNA-binding CsgD family transcriptional regulator